jgi:hypothetical protein
VAKRARNRWGFAPPVDIYEDEHKLVLKLEIPGIRQKDLDVRMENRDKKPGFRNQSDATLAFAAQAIQDDLVNEG